MANKDDLSQRILKTKKESEELQAQLQKLIELGKSQSYVNSKPIKQENDNALNINKVQIVKSYDPNYSKHINKPVPSKRFDKSKASSSNSNINPKVESPKKTKYYDVNETREYIKKQKEKRLKQQTTVKETEADIRKKKLEELRKKSRELVTRNIESNKVRSKSRERNDYVRLDEFGRKGVTGYEHHNNAESKKPSKINVLSNIILKSPDESKHSTSRITQQTINEPISVVQDQYKTVEENIEKINVSNCILQSEVDSKFEIVQKYSDKCNLESQEESQIHKNKSLDKNVCDKDINVGNFKKEFPEWLQESPAQAYPFNFINTVKRKLQFVINSPKPTVDIGVQSTYPQNVELGIRHSRPSYHSNKNEIADSNRVSNLKSFKSHNYENLDAKAIEHLELIATKDRLYSDKVPSVVPTEYNEERQLVSKSADTESESDTSKNIPEISSESGSSLQKNAESVRRNLNLDFEFINTDKIKELKLKQPITSTVTTIKSDIKYSPSENAPRNRQAQTVDNKYLKPPDYITSSKSLNNQYASDFESGTDIKEVINRSRESILSFNSPEYTKQIIKSPQPDKVSLKNDLSGNNLSIKSDIINPPPAGIVQNLNCLNNGLVNGSISSNSEVAPSSIVSTNFDTSKHIKSNASKSISILSKSKRDKLTEQLSESKKNTVEDKVETFRTESNDFSKKTLHNGNVSNSLAPTITGSNSISTNLENSNASTAQSNSYIESGASVLSKSNKSQNITTRRNYRNVLVNERTFDIPSLKNPDVHLIKNTNRDYEQKDALIKNVSIRSKTNEDSKDLVNVNEIHLKFEAEIHLLNDFNESLRKFSAAEKVFETLKNKNELVASNILQNQDTQTSFPKDSIVSNGITEDVPSPEKSREVTSFINFSRGSFVDQNLSNDTLDNSVLMPLDVSKTVESTDVQLSKLSTSKIESVIENECKLSNFENLQDNNFAGFSLNMFDQLIKDEDARLENLKTILKIREKILLDRTRAELAWLEIQKKHFKETGNLQEASAVRKKQRAILLNHEKEKHEMQKLKQMQKAASAERKIILKQQRNLIRKKLSTDNMLGKMKVNTPRERRLSGPLKVIQSHTESIMSETSVSRRSSSDRDKEVYSILSHHSVSKVSEISEVGISLPQESQLNLHGVESTKRQEHIKKTLLMREAALKKRKKAAEELLQWHKQLLEEEQRINELELKATSVISQKLSANTSDDIDKYKFMGKQLNQLWFNLTGSQEKKFAEEKVYPMSQIALERFCKSAREYSLKAKKLLKGNSSDYSDSSVSENIPQLKQSEEKESHKQKTISSNEYASDFEIESITNEKNVNVIENISELICNFGKIEDDILSLNFMHSKKSDEEKATTVRTDSDLDVSVIETNKDSKEHDQSPSCKTSTSTKSNQIQNQIEDFFIITENTIEDEVPSRNKISSENISVRKEQNDSDLMKFEGTDPSINTDHSKVVNSEIQENLNDSKEILKLLGEPEDINIEINLPSESDKSKENINTSEDILLTLTQKGSNVDSTQSNFVSESDELKQENLAVTSPIEETLTKDSKDEDDTPTESDKVEVVAEEAGEQDNLKVSHQSISENAQESTDIKSEPESQIEEFVVATETQKNSAAESAIISNTAEEKIVDPIILSSSEIVQPEYDGLLNDAISAQNSSQLNSIPSDIVKENGEEVISIKLVSRNELSLQFEKEDGQSTDVSNSITADSHSAVLHISNNTEQKVISNCINSEINIDKEIDETVDTVNEVSLSEDSQNHSEERERVKQKIDITTISAEDREKSDEITSPDIVKKDSKVLEENIKATLIEEQLIVNGDLEYVEINESKSEYESNIEGNLVVDEIIENSIKSDDKIKTVVNGSVHLPESDNQSSINEQSNSDISSIIEDQDSKSIQDEISTSKTELKESNVDYVNSFESPSVISDNQTNNLANDKQPCLEKSNSTESSKSTSSGDKSPKHGTIDVKKRVLEILADASPGSRGDKSPRLQDLYVTTYDLVSPPNSPDSGYPVNNRKVAATSSIFGNEAEEILKKQLAIEQEIKQITEQQQREQQIPFLYVREIPNKPPPPYTPPSSQLPVINVATVIPTVEEVEEITKYSAKILYKAYLSNNLDNISISENTLSLISKNIPKERYKFVFDVCKDLAKQYYKQFEEEKVPSWLQLSKKPHLSKVKPLDVNGLERHITAKLKEIFGYEKPKKRENAIIKWSRKKRDHVDEILVTECQAEEVQWTNYEKDELLVMDQLTNEIMNELIKETAEEFSKFFSKRN